jgi:plastocyanin
MKRREFFQKAGAGSAALMAGAVAPPVRAHSEHAHQHAAVTGPLASATVSFGQWQSDPPFDRFPSNNDRLRNNHQLIPGEVTIKAGGSVNFIIAGFHLVLVYDDGTQASSINSAKTIPVTVPPGPPLIDDDTNRIYRGLDPSARGGVQDRIEVVHFTKPGRYLVACGVQPHFLEGMFGFVRVIE